MYTISLIENSLVPITGLFLNVINDPNNGLPTGGPGRMGLGNFVVTQLTADVLPAPAPFKFGSNYFEFVLDPGISWAAAEAAAASMTYLGATGYLATVASATENSFLDNVVTTNFPNYVGPLSI